MSEQQAEPVIKELGDPSQLTLQTRLRATDLQLGQATLEFIDFTESVKGHWTLTPAGLIQFETQSAADRYAALAARRAQLIAARVADQRQLLELTR
jgi:hypothetical protein